MTHYKLAFYLMYRVKGNTDHYYHGSSAEIEGVDIQSKENKLKIELDMSKFNLDDSKNIEKYIQKIISNTL